MGRDEQEIYKLFKLLREQETIKTLHEFIVKKGKGRLSNEMRSFLSRITELIQGEKKEKKQ